MPVPVTNQNNLPVLHDPGPLRGLLALFDERFGPFFNLAGVSAHDLAPEWWIYSCDIARVPAGDWFKPYPTSAAGSSLDGSAALRRCLGEAAERYSGLYSAEYDNFESLALNQSPFSERFPRCAEWEDSPPSFKSDRANTVVRHSSVLDLATNAEVQIPASFVHLGFAWGEESLPVPPISTGLAFHTDLNSAIWSGLCEVAERDTMMRFWHVQKSARKIRFEKVQLPDSVALRLLTLEQAKLEPILLDITDDDFGICTTFCLLRAEAFPYHSVGVATHATPTEACSKALDEAISLRAFAKSRAGLTVDLQSVHWVQTLESHAILYAYWKDSPAIAELLNEPRITEVSWDEFSSSRSTTSPVDESSLRHFAQRLSQRGLNSLWKDVTVPEILPFGHVVKVIVPEAVPLSQSINTRWLASPRLSAELARSGLKVNQYPHPFA